MLRGSRVFLVGLELFCIQTLEVRSSRDFSEMTQWPMNAELSTSGGRMNGGALSLPTTEKAEGKLKLSLADLVAPVSDDLLLLNDNLQKVSSPTTLEICTRCRLTHV